MNYITKVRDIMTTTAINNTMKYSLQQFKEITFHGFDFVIPDDAMAIINYLTGEVGPSTYINSPIFQKKEHKEGDTIFSANSNSNNRNRNRNKKGNKFMESHNDDWEQLRTFQATKIEQKSGLDGHIDMLRSNLNKLTDKTFLDIRDKIIGILDIILSSEEFCPEIANKVGTVIYDIASTNKFFSKIFADLYAELVTKYGCLKSVFDDNFSTFIAKFETIQYADPDVNYDKFCENNKINEKRKANSQFFVNLALNGFISKLSVARILKFLLDTIMNTISRTDKKNEVDELTENVAILFNKHIIDAAEEDSCYEEDELEINGNTIIQTITLLAKSKVKDYKSLSNKAIFKYMDLVEM